jgi:hypothetical protein
MAVIPMRYQSIAIEPLLMQDAPAFVRHMARFGTPDRIRVLDSRFGMIQMVLYWRVDV